MEVVMKMQSKYINFVTILRGLQCRLLLILRISRQLLKYLTFV